MPDIYEIEVGGQVFEVDWPGGAPPTPADFQAMVGVIPHAMSQYKGMGDLHQQETWRELKAFAEGKGFTVTSTTGGTHNFNSKHFNGEAVDVRTKDKSPQEVNAFITLAEAQGYRVRDERKRPAGQKEWSGPHLHLERAGKPGKATKNVGRPLVTLQKGVDPAAQLLGGTHIGEKPLTQEPGPPRSIQGVISRYPEYSPGAQEKLKSAQSQIQAGAGDPRNEGDQEMFVNPPGARKVPSKETGPGTVVRQTLGDPYRTVEDRVGRPLQRAIGKHIRNISFGSSPAVKLVDRFMPDTSEEERNEAIGAWTGTPKNIEESVLFLALGAGGKLAGATGKALNAAIAQGNKRAAQAFAKLSTGAKGEASAVTELIQNLGRTPQKGYQFVPKVENPAPGTIRSLEQRTVDKDGFVRVGGDVEIYHGTSARRANKIKDEGFRIRAVAKQTMGGDPESHRDSLWFSKTPEGAKRYADLHQNPTVITVRIPRAEWERLNKDGLWRNSGPDSFWTSEPVPAKYIYDPQKVPQKGPKLENTSGAKGSTAPPLAGSEGSSTLPASTSKITRALQNASADRIVAFVAMQAARKAQAAATKARGKKAGGFTISSEEIAYFKAWAKEKGLQGAKAVEDFLIHVKDELGEDVGRWRDVLRRVTGLSEDQATSGRNAWADVERLVRSKATIEKGAAKSFDESIKEALDVLRTNPARATELQIELAEKGRVVSDAEHAILILERARIKSESRKLAVEAAKAGSDEEVAAIFARDNSLEEMWEKNDLALRNAGREVARSLASRKITVGPDFTPVEVVGRARIDAKRMLTPAEKAELEGKATRIQQLDKELEGKLPDEPDPNAGVTGYRQKVSEGLAEINAQKEAIASEQATILKELSEAPKKAKKSKGLPKDPTPPPTQGALDLGEIENSWSSATAREMWHRLQGEGLDQKRFPEKYKRLAEIARERKALKEAEAQFKADVARFEADMRSVDRKMKAADRRRYVEWWKDTKGGRMAQLMNQIDEARTKLANDDAFWEAERAKRLAKKTKAERFDQDPEVFKKVLERQMLQDDIRRKWNSLRIDAELRLMNKGEKFLENIAKLRDFKASLDMSAPFYQGGFAMFADPKSWARAWKKVGAANAEDGYNRYVAEVRASGENYTRAKAARLELPIDGISPGEEAFVSRASSGFQKYSGMNWSKRQYAAYLNELRMGMFNSLVDASEKKGLPLDLEGLRSIARHVNQVTGRSQWLKTAPFAAHVLFAPRYWISLLETASGASAWSALGLAKKTGNWTPFKKILGQYAQGHALAFTSLYAAKYTLEATTDYTVELNPFHTDWGRAVRTLPNGDRHVLDILPPQLQQGLRSLARWTGFRAVGSDGKRIVGSQAILEDLERSVSGKTSPGLSIYFRAGDTAYGKKAFGKSYDLTTWEGMQNWGATIGLPISIEGAAELLDTGGLSALEKALFIVMQFGGKGGTIRTPSTKRSGISMPKGSKPPTGIKLPAGMKPPTG